MSLTREQIATALAGHHPTRGVAVASGTTCQCGYWDRSEYDRARDIGRTHFDTTHLMGRDGLDLHRADIVLALITDTTD